MILTILKYLGLCLAAASSIWATTQELTIKTPDNRKQLTKAGIVSILFVIIGLIISIVSDDVGRKRAAKEQFAKLAAETRRTNEITIASQPLTSLKFVLHFESTDTTIRKLMEDGDSEIQENNESVQGGVPSVPYKAMEYKYNLIPMLEFLAQLGGAGRSVLETSEEEEENEENIPNGIIALIPLDGSPNTILSFGEIYGEVNWDDGSADAELSAGFSPIDRQARTTVSSPNIIKDFSAAGPSKYAIAWNLDPLTLENSVDRVNASIRSGGKLPQVLKFVILRIYETVPFAQNNFALTTTNLWDNGNEGAAKNLQNKVSNVTLTATVNGFSELEYRYRLANVYPKTLYDDFGEEIEIDCTILEFRLD